MFESWVASQDSGMSPGYRELFMQQEKALREVMQEDLVEGDNITDASRQ